MARRNSILIIIFILGLILFDTVQQHYYISTFNLSQQPILLGHLLKSHTIRWVVWGLIGIPFGMYVWNQLKKDGMRFRSFVLIFPATVFAVVVSILLITLISIWQQDLNISEAIIEFYVFFTFQKGLTFFMAYGMMVILLNNHLQMVRVKTQEAEIVNLTQTSEELIKNFTLRNEEPFLSIKTGNKVTPIALSDIIWIQADDYCVRIHTAAQSYTLRKSMKALEVQLSPFRFIRIHRGALLNLNYIEQINFESSTVRLQNERELPISRSGIKTLKNRIKESSL